MYYIKILLLALCCTYVLPRLHSTVVSFDLLQGPSGHKVYVFSDYHTQVADKQEEQQKQEFINVVHSMYQQDKALSVALEDPTTSYAALDFDADKVPFLINLVSAIRAQTKVMAESLDTTGIARVVLDVLNYHNPPDWAYRGNHTIATNISKSCCWTLKDVQDEFEVQVKSIELLHTATDNTQLKEQIAQACTLVRNYFARFLDKASELGIKDHDFMLFAAAKGYLEVTEQLSSCEQDYQQAQEQITQQIQKLYNNLCSNSSYTGAQTQDKPTYTLCKKLIEHNSHYTYDHFNTCDQALHDLWLTVCLLFTCKPVQDSPQAVLYKELSLQLMRATRTLVTLQALTRVALQPDNTHIVCVGWQHAREINAVLTACGYTCILHEGAVPPFKYMPTALNIRTLPL